MTEPILESRPPTPTPHATSNGPAKRWRVADLPLVPGLPFFGSAFDIQSETFHTTLEQWADEYGERYRWRAAKVEFVVFSNANAIRPILQARPDAFRRTPRIDELFMELGVDGLFNAEGEKWRKQRRLIGKAFNATQVISFFPQLSRVCERLNKLWQNRNEIEPLDILRDLERFTVDVTTWLAFGHDSNTIEGGGDLLQKDIELIFPAISRRLAATLPWWRWFPIPRERAAARASVNLHHSMGALIERTREKMITEPERRDAPTNLLEGLLAAQEAEDPSSRFSDEEVLGNVITLLLAGEDTTAHTLGWLVHAFATAPEMQSRARAEVDDVLVNKRHLQSHEELRRMPFLDACIQEILRLRSVAPLLIMQANQDEVVDGIDVPKGTLVVALTRRAACSPDSFSEPLEFCPERWLRDDADAVARCPVHQPKNNMVFGSGPRICPGRGLALLEIGATMAMILRNYEIEMAPGCKAVREIFSFTMRPGDLSVLLKKRA
jgi:cytochrome P450